MNTAGNARKLSETQEKALAAMHQAIYEAGVWCGLSPADAWNEAAFRHIHFKMRAKYGPTPVLAPQESGPGESPADYFKPWLAGDLRAQQERGIREGIADAAAGRGWPDNSEADTPYARGYTLGRRLFETLEEVRDGSG
jgi:hypothetical protein